MAEGALSLRVDLSSPAPAYRQIADALRAFLVGGSLRPGDALPPVRQLAIDLGLNHNTVAMAYRILAEEGWLDLRRGRGAAVVERSGPRPSREEAAAFRQRLRELLAEARTRGVPILVLLQELDAAAQGIAGAAPAGEEA